VEIPLIDLQRKDRRRFHSEDGIDEDIDLIDSGADEARNHQETDPFDRWMSEIKIESKSDSLLPQKRELEKKLDYPSSQNTQGECHDGYVKCMIK
jgi:hypothetical protein